MKEKVLECIERSIKESGCSEYYRKVILGFVKADDEGFHTVCKHAVPTHALPKEVFSKAETVIVYFLPFSDEVIDSNIDGIEASTLWAKAYIKTNRLISQINENIIKLLKNEGYEGFSLPATHNFNVDTLTSDWSHRHIAYLAGIGNFGLNNMLITQSGCCGRLGSLITSFKVDVKSEIKREHCIYKFNGKCKLCMARCVENALEETNFKRHHCYERCLKNADIHKKLGVADVCGKCLVGLPCSKRNPLK